ncbi:translation initiation factor IF-2 [Geitlerinema sp. P-1104]|uniref:translation initiation factor IF-2 n=1 Tax=Geitlerinema sp. P-1104 TaxID=2546230 RepID=UPI00147686F3|nr:translation initiation factor IF-2 [Geitlerinema sp. P-1104]NMG58428.1 translation initiation factor IF-2 [Geitlerinema sp. P-1104]
MNNGKVRLYDLSRELNVDNKQVLAFCDQLDIAYKSHSSTITEADAARIRQEAENAPAVSEPTRPSGSGPNNHRKKQQILKIEHRSLNAKPAVQGSDPDSNVDNSPNSNATSSDLDSPELVDKPVRPKSPSPANSQPPKTPPVEATSPQEPSSSPAPSRDESDSAPVEPAAREPKAPEPDPKPEEKPEDVPQLIGPPPRPQPRAKKSKGRDKPTVERPTIAKDKPSSSPRPPARNKDTDSSRPVSSPQKPSRPAAREERVEEPVSAGTPSRPEPKRPVPKLKRPPELVRLNAKTEEVEPETPDNEPLAVEPEDETDETEQLTLKRPKLPRKAKTKKRRTTEEDPVESLEAANKANKPKRRVRPIDDDDEDFEADLNTDSTGAMEVSLSIARPPKASKSKSESRPSTQQRRKPAPQQRGSGDSSGGSSSSSRNRRDRRERANKVERPELVEIRDNLTVRELADLLCVPETEIVKRLFMQGIAVNVTQTLDVPTATMVAEELDVLVETPEKEEEARKVTDMIDATDLDSLQRRPPVVTIMGHVDHGKTTLLDSIRKTKVAQGEAGGITQHTGAYHVDVEHEGVMQQIVFLDTPGHEAFTAMRARGARVTDIAILVVAADDGVQPQTIEAISHAKAAGVPLVVAVNKMDKEQANPDRVKQELMEHGLVPEEWGGDTVMVPVSAITGDNLDTLLEMIILVSEVEELSANPDRPARGTVIEAHLDKARGSVATLLVQNGTLRVGDTLVAGSVFAKVRAMIDDRGNRVDEAKPSFAVEVLGMNEVPEAGDEFEVFTNEKEARSEADRRKDEHRQSRLQQTMASRRVTLSSLSARASEGELKELNLVLKADVQGSLEAILGSLEQLPQDEVQLRVLYAAPGEIAETDIDLAAASDAVILGFNTTLASGARQAAEREGVDVRDYSVIYNLLDDIQGAMEGLLDPEMVEEELGQAQVRAIFPSGRGQVAGCYVLSGQLVRNAKVRILRNDKVVHENVLDSLRRMREDVRDVKSGYECGLGIDRFSDWQEGDIVYCYRMASKRRTLASR